MEYLRQTDFQRFAQESGANLDELVANAQEHYREGCRLADKQQFEAAIESYSRAVDEFPLFYEAIDNRAFALMDLGEHGKALADFELSLSINPDGMIAMASRAECLMALGKANEAEAILIDACKRWPEERKLRSALKRVQKASGKSKPWWKFGS